MTWKLLHWLFGWHFVAAPFCNDHHIRHIKTTPTGRPYIDLYGEMIFLDEEEQQKRVIPLTFVFEAEQENAEMRRAG